MSAVHVRKAPATSPEILAEARKAAIQGREYVGPLPCPGSTGTAAGLGAVLHFRDGCPGFFRRVAMKITLSSSDRRGLVQAVWLARGAEIRTRAAILLLLADGLTVARIARLAGLSRPTVYRYARAYDRLRSTAALDTKVAAELARRRPAGRS